MARLSLFRILGLSAYPLAAPLKHRGTQQCCGMPELVFTSWEHRVGLRKRADGAADSATPALPNTAAA